MAKAEKILELVRNKTKRVNLALNPKLWDLLERSVLEDGLTSTQKIEELIIQYLDKKGQL